MNSHGTYLRMKRLATDILEHISTTGIVRNTVRTALCLLLPAFALSGARADCQPTPNGLVSWWPGDGSGADLVGTNHGILQGGVSASALAWVDSGFSFDGTNGFVQVPDSVALKQAQLRALELEGNQKLWRWLIVVTLVILIVETWIAARLSRRAPVQAESAS